MPRDHCLQLLREADPDRYLACLWLPLECRGAVSALYAFNAEITRIPALVSEPMPGEIRLQWWREVIEGKRESGDNPVAVALLDAISAHDLPATALLSYLDARVFDLYHDPMPDRPTFEAYAGETASALLQLAAQCAGASRGRALADACGHGGVAQTIAAVLRSVSLHRQQKRCYLPGDVLVSTGLDVETWLNEPPDNRHVSAVEAMLAWGRDHLTKSREAIADLDNSLRPVLLPLAPLPAYFDAAGRTGMDIFTSVPDISPLKRQWIFAKKALIG